MLAPNHNPDASVVAIFKQMAIKNDAKTAQAGRLICDDIEVCELRYPGSKNVGVYPATSMSHWQKDPITGENVLVTYAERFRHQYQQFRLHAQQTMGYTQQIRTSPLRQPQASRGACGRKRRRPATGDQARSKAMTTRGQIPAYTDRWMMGDRYGEIVKTSHPRKGMFENKEIAHVKLDKSGQTVRVLLDDCTEVAA